MLFIHFPMPIVLILIQNMFGSEYTGKQVGMYSNCEMQIYNLQNQVQKMMLKKNEFKRFCLPTFMSVELRQRKKIIEIFSSL